MEAQQNGIRRPRLLIADDHAIFTESLRDSLERWYTVLGTIMDGRAMIYETLRLRPDVVIADIGMPILNGLDAARRIKAQAPYVKFVFLTMRDDPNLAAAALEMGEIAYVLKHSGVSELREAIEQVLRGRSYITPRLRAEDWMEQKARARQFSKELTPRQREVLQLFAEGASMKEIAGILNLSEKTVEFHKHRLMEVFHLKSNAALVLFALKQGLIAMEPCPAQRPEGVLPTSSTERACALQCDEQIVEANLSDVDAQSLGCAAASRPIGDRH
jgi:DNA-binding NarL/FixJ family response regulator